MTAFIDSLSSKLAYAVTILKISSPFDLSSHTVLEIKDYYQHLFHQINIYGVIMTTLNGLIIMTVLGGLFLAARKLWRRIGKTQAPRKGPSEEESPFGLSIPIPVIGRIITLLIVISIIFFAASTIRQEGTKIQNVLRILIMNIFLQISIVCVLLSNIPLRAFILRPFKVLLRQYPYFFIFVINIFILSFLINYGLMRVIHIPPSHQPIIILLLKQNHPGIISLIGIQAILLAPVAEELLFRGFLFRVIHSRISFFPAALISSMVFASLHKNLFIFLPLTCLGMAFAYAYKKSRNILFPILLHASYNAIMFLYVICIKHIQT